MKMLLALSSPTKILMPVGDITSKQIRSLCGISRKREFEIHATVGNCHMEESKSWPYKGAYKTWFKLTNEAYITSHAYLSANLLTWHHATHPTLVVKSPAGMHFENDNNGVKLVRDTDGMDYHPTFEEWHSSKFATIVRAKMAENFKCRQAEKKAAKLVAKNKAKAAKEEKLFQRDLANIRVSLEDSRKAGNCVEGSLVFAERKLGIARAEILSAGYLFSVPASRLLTHANGDREAVMRACHVAYRRETTISI